MPPKPLLNIPQGTKWDPEKLLGSQLYAAGGGAMLSQLARGGQLGNYAVAQQEIADQVRQQAAPAPPFGQVSPLPSVSGTSSVLPPGMQDPITGAFKVPDGIRAQLKRAGIDPDLISQTVNRNLLAQSGADYQQRLLFGQQAAKSPDEVQAAKEELFSKTARAIQASPGDKDRILEATFSGPNGDRLLAEYDAHMAKDAHGGFLDKLGDIKHGAATSFGQLMSGLQGPADVLRGSLAVLVGAKKEDGAPYTAADVGREASQLPTDIINVLSLGTAGLMDPEARSTSNVPSTQRIAETMRGGVGGAAAMFLDPALGLTRALQAVKTPNARPYEAVFGFLGDVALDPTTYLTLGGGGLGVKGTRIAGEFAQKAKFLNHLGLDELIPRFKNADPGTWDTLVNDLGKELGPDAIAGANDAAKVFRISAENAHGAQGWAGYRQVLAGSGIDAEQLFPKVVAGTGVEAKQAARLTSVRGGVGLRGGIGVGPYQVRGSINLLAGKPMGSWFTKEGNRFHQLVSATLDQTAGVFHYGGETDRKWVHANRGLFNATMEQAVLGQSVKHHILALDQEVGGVEDRIGRWLKQDPEQNNVRLADVIEKQERSDYWDLVPKDVREQGQRLWQVTDEARSIAAAESGTDIPMLREMANTEETRLRYVPRKVVDGISRSIKFPIIQTEPGMAKARGLRAGTQVVGPDGSTRMLTEGSFAEVREATAAVLGESVYNMDVLKTYRAYLHTLANVAGLNRTYRGLTEAGLLIPDAANLVPGAPFRSGADKVRAIWTTPEDKAKAALADAQATLTTRSEELTTLARGRAVAAEEERRLQAELASYASRQADADSKVSALSKSQAEKDRMLKLATEGHATSRQEMVFSHARARSASISSAETDLKGVQNSKQLLSQRLKDLDTQHKAALAELDKGYAAQKEVLGTTPEDLRAALAHDLKTTGAEAVGGRRPYNQVKAELTATRHRLAQVEGGILAKGRQTQALLRSAKKGVAAKRERGLIVQRTLGKRAADLQDQIEAAEGAVDVARRASNQVAEDAARLKLTGLQTERAAVLKDAEKATAEAAELGDLLDAGEAGMRFAELREAQVLGAETGAMVDSQVHRMGPSLQEHLSRLFREHDADLVAEMDQTVTAAPRLKFLNKAMREYSVVDTSVAAISELPPSGALADYAQEYLARVGQRGSEQVKAWEAAVGEEQALRVAIEEHTRQHSAMLARELDLKKQYDAAMAMNPRERALATHQAQGDELNMLTAELHKNERELEWWQANRDELRKTQTLKSISLAEIVKGDEVLQRKVGAVQRLMDSDAEVASRALQDVMAVPAIFKLMAPEVEHVTAVLGKLNFMENGAAMPKEAAQVIDRLVNIDQGHEAFGKVLAFFNKHWKRSVLATPGSMFRRWVGNTYAATVLAGVQPVSFRKAFDAMGLAKNAKSLDDIANPELRRYMELALEYNIFEGQLSSLATDTSRFAEGTARHPVQAFGNALQWRAMRGEDIARFAQFIEGLDSGMGAHASRMWTGKYHFFNSELTERERTYLKPLYPFYAYLKNNFALQFSTLFQQPGKIALYGTAMRDFSAQPEGSTAPGWVEQAGGFPVTKDTWLQNTLLDTSPLGLPQTILGLAQGGPGSGWKPQNLLTGELGTSLTPAAKLAESVGLGINPNTGTQSYPQEMAPSLTPIKSALQALGMVNDAGRWNPRALAAIETLTPQGTRAIRGVSGGLTPGQGDQRKWWLISQLLGPGFQQQTPRRAAGAYAERGRVVQDILNSLTAREGTGALPQGTVPSTGELSKQERTRRALQMLGVGQ